MSYGPNIRLAPRTGYDPSLGLLGYFVTPLLTATVARDGCRSDLMGEWAISHLKVFRLDGYDG